MGRAPDRARRVDRHRQCDVPRRRRRRGAHAAATGTRRGDTREGARMVARARAAAAVADPGAARVGRTDRLLSLAVVGLPVAGR